MRVLSRYTNYEKLKSRLIKTNECISSFGINKFVFFKEDGIEHRMILRKFIYEMANKVRLSKSEYAIQSCKNKDCINPKHLIKVLLGSEEHTPMSSGIRVGSIDYSKTGKHKKNYLTVKCGNGKEIKLQTISAYKKFLKQDPGAKIVPRKPTK